jgi:hypothetical protein
MTVLEITATTAGLARVTRLLAGEPLRPGYITVVGSVLLFAINGRRLLVACPAQEADATRSQIRAALGPSPLSRITALTSGALTTRPAVAVVGFGAGAGSAEIL